MADFILSCCSTVDLKEEHLTKRDIKYVCFHYTIDGVTYPDDFGKSMSFDAFYGAMANGADTKTSQVNVDEYIAYFTPFLEEGKDILHVSLSSGISGSYNSARIAAEDLSAKYPERKIYIIDSLAAASGFGLLMDELADLRDSGMGIDELAAWLEENKLKMHHWVLTTDLTHLIKGGRVSKVSGWFGTVLKICPIINVNSEGKLIPRSKIRGKEKGIEELAERMVQFAQNGLDYSGKCYICHSNCYADARKVADIIEKKFKKLNGKVLINSIGTTIGSHTGPGTTALFFWGDERTL
ncbi:MAG: DegV family protein [Ruminococcaceae bacterium]|nr:DegV family protein [Oscillospiraceae bacterium]